MTLSRQRLNTVETSDLQLLYNYIISLTVGVGHPNCVISAQASSVRILVKQKQHFVHVYETTELQYNIDAGITSDIRTLVPISEGIPIGLGITER